MRKTTPENMKNQIIEAYIDLIYKIGIDKISYQKLADEVGCTVGSIQYYYDIHSHEIFDDSLNFFLDKTYRYIEDSLLEKRKLPEFDPVLEYVETMFKWSEDLPKLSNFNLYYYYACNALTRSENINEKLTQRAVLRITALIHEGIGLGIYKTNPSVPKAAQKIHFLITGNLVLALTMKLEIKRQEHKKFLLETLRQILHKNTD